MLREERQPKEEPESKSGFKGQAEKRGDISERGTGRGKSEEGAVKESQEGEESRNTGILDN